MTDNVRLPNITALTVTIHNIKILDYLLPIVEESLQILNLVILSFVNEHGSDPGHHLPMPNTLLEVQIEFGTHDSKREDALISGMRER
jgi:hypothetical protein